MSGQGSGSIENRQSHMPQQSAAQLETFKRFWEASGQALSMADLEGHVFFGFIRLKRTLSREGP